MKPKPDAVQATVEALLEARKSGRPVRWSEALVSTDFGEAASVQAEVARRLHAEVAAWKVAVREGVALGAPIFRHLLYGSGCRWALPKDGPVRIEAEIAFRLGRDLPPRERPYGREEVLAAVDAVLAGIELVETRIVAFEAAPFAGFLADNMANGGYVAGSAVTDWRALDLASRRCRVLVDGATVHDRIGGHPLQDPVIPLAAYAGKPMDRLGGLRAGQIVTTGSLCGIVAVEKPAEVRVEIEGIGTVELAVSQPG